MSRQKQSSRHSKKRKLVSCFLVYMGAFVLFLKGQKYWKKIVELLKKENVAVLAIEHGYSIFSTKEEA